MKIHFLVLSLVLASSRVLGADALGDTWSLSAIEDSGSRPAVTLKLELQCAKGGCRAIRSVEAIDAPQGSGPEEFGTFEGNIPGEKASILVGAFLAAVPKSAVPRTDLSVRDGLLRRASVKRGDRPSETRWVSQNDSAGVKAWKALWLELDRSAKWVPRRAARLQCSGLKRGNGFEYQCSIHNVGKESFRVPRLDPGHFTLQASSSLAPVALKEVYLTPKTGGLTGKTLDPGQDYEFNVHGETHDGSFHVSGTRVEIDLRRDHLDSGLPVLLMSGELGGKG